jgi:hypothetical protein
MIVAEQESALQRRSFLPRRVQTRKSVVSGSLRSTPSRRSNRARQSPRACLPGVLERHCPARREATRGISPSGRLGFNTRQSVVAQIFELASG